MAVTYRAALGEHETQRANYRCGRRMAANFANMIAAVTAGACCRSLFDLLKTAQPRIAAVLADAGFTPCGRPYLASAVASMLGGTSGESEPPGRSGSAEQNSIN